MFSSAQKNKNLNESLKQLQVLLLGLARIRIPSITKAGEQYTFTHYYFFGNNAENFFENLFTADDIINLTNEVKKFIVQLKDPGDLEKFIRDMREYEQITKFSMTSHLQYRITLHREFEKAINGIERELAQYRNLLAQNNSPEFKKDDLRYSPWGPCTPAMFHQPIPTEVQFHQEDGSVEIIRKDIPSLRLE